MEVEGPMTRVGCSPELGPRVAREALNIRSNPAKPDICIPHSTSSLRISLSVQDAGRAVGLI